MTSSRYVTAGLLSAHTQRSFACFNVDDLLRQPVLVLIEFDLDEYEYWLPVEAEEEKTAPLAVSENK